MTEAALDERYRQAEHARRNAQTKAVLAIEAAMSDEDKARFLELTAAPGTGMHGAHVADVLDIYADHDACLEWTEPFYDNLDDAALYAALDFDPDGELPAEPDKMLTFYMKGIVLSRAVLARAVLMQAVPDRESVQALTLAALAAQV